MLNQILKDSQEHFDKALEHLKREFSMIRTSRASTSLLEDLKVEAYNSSFSLKELAAISVHSPTLLLVSPFDPSIVYQVEKAIRISPLGLNPVTEDNLIRVNIPPMSQERREELLKIVAQKSEETRVAIRQIRQDKIQSAKDLEEAGKVSKDDEERFKRGLQKTVEEYNGKIELLKSSKEKELSEV